MDPFAAESRTLVNVAKKKCCLHLLEKEKGRGGGDCVSCVYLPILLLCQRNSELKLGGYWVTNLATLADN